MIKTLANALTIVAVAATPISAQTGARKTDAKMEGMDRGKMEMMEPATGWKELDAFHKLLAAS